MNSGYGPETKWGRQSFFDGGLLSFIGWTSHHCHNLRYMLPLGFVYGLWLEN